MSLQKHGTCKEAGVSYCNLGRNHSVIVSAVTEHLTEATEGEGRNILWSMVPKGPVHCSGKGMLGRGAVGGRGGMERSLATVLQHQERDSGTGNR